jgi:hypothetical protein
MELFARPRHAPAGGNFPKVEEMLEIHSGRR